MLANLGHYVLATYDLHDQPYLVWLITIPAAIISAAYGIIKGRKARVKNHLDQVYGLVWIAMFISVLVVLFYIPNVNYAVNPIILAFAAAGTFISGSMLRFKPLILGGIALWIASIVGFNLSVDDQYLIGAIGIFAGYLIPGYLLKKAENA